MSFLYIIENQKLHRVDPRTGDWGALGGQNWKVHPIVMTTLDDGLYVIENSRTIGAARVVTSSRRKEEL